MSNDEIAEQLAAIANRQDELILLVAGRLDWSAAEYAAKFRGHEPKYTRFEERDGRFEAIHRYPVASASNPN